uniref:ascorbate ferrireductase (transmembrane) n=1 Tax=Echinococcus canadensis TaxID=519352 RepID=A0A915EU98_9CEST
MAVHASGLLLVLCTLYFVAPFKSLISWHPLFMVLGLCGFSLQGIIVFNKYSSLVPNAPAHRKYTLHWLLQTLGLLSILAGCAVILKVKSDGNKSHMTTWHGCLGYAFLLHGLLQSLFGVVKHYAFLRPWMNPRTFHQIHAVSGAVFFSLGCLVTALGLHSDWFQQKVLVDVIQDQGVRLLIGYFLTFLLGLLAIVALKQVYDKYFSSIGGNKNTSNAQSKKPKRSN